MTEWTKSFRLWLGSAAILTLLFLAAAPVAAYGPGDDQGQNGGGQYIPSPEPATLTLIALGGGAVALARYRKSRNK
jgi:hypothetical protein